MTRLPNEMGVELQAVFDNGQFRTTATVASAADGSFRFVDDPAAGVILPLGTYSLVQVQPAAFIDGRDTPGTPSPV